VSSAHELARVLRNNLQPNGFTDTPWQWGVVQAINSSPNSVDLYLDGATTVTPNIRYLASYSPTVGDVVLVGRHITQAGQDRFVLGKLA
jgi:hypothetical protein